MTGKRNCASCSNELLDESPFCPSCGQPTKSTPQSTGTVVQPSPTHASNQQNPNAESEESNEQGCLGSIGSMVSGAVGCGCAAIMIIGGIIALILGLFAG